MHDQHAAVGSPWEAEDLLRTLGLSLVGVALAGVAWYQSEQHDVLADQVRWANLSVGGFVVGSYAAVGWLLRGRRAVGRRQRALLAFVRPLPLDRAEVVRLASTDLVAGDGLRYFHLAACPLARSRGWRPAGRDELLTAGRTPCGVCRP